MDFKTIIPESSISLFVKNILIFEEDQVTQETILPFYADGYPGLLFHESKNGLLVNPHNKRMPIIFLYGQTLKSIELVLNGAYKLVVFQLYPFVLKSFFDITPNDINDSCYDLEEHLYKTRENTTMQKLILAKTTTLRIKILSQYLQSIFEEKREELDLTIGEAILQIIDKKGQLSIKELCENIHITERTFERRFFNAVGITAKQFAKIIQFQESLEQLTIKDFSKLTDIVYANGFADQSHFIKVFKAFTGKTPFAFVSNK